MGSFASDVENVGVSGSEMLGTDQRPQQVDGDGGGDEAGDEVFHGHNRSQAMRYRKHSAIAATVAAR
jgi:hypothetical protein